MNFAKNQSLKIFIASFIIQSKNINWKYIRDQNIIL